MSQMDFPDRNDVRGPSPDGQIDARGRALEIGDIIRILSERRYMILGIAVLGLVLGIIASLLMTPLYRASALIELNPPKTEVLDESKSGRSSGGVSTQELIGTQLGLLRSNSLARRVVEDLNLLSRPEYGSGEGSRQQRLDRAVALLQANTLVENTRNSTLISVSYSSPDPGLAARIANALTDGFIASALERRYDSSSYARDFLKNQIAATKQALEESERALNSYAISSGIFRTPGQMVDGNVTEGTSLAATNLEALNAAHNEARIKRINAGQAYRNTSRLTGASGADSTAGLRQQRAILQAEYEDKAKLFKSDYPEMVQMVGRIESLDRAIVAERGNSSANKSADLLAEYRAAQAAESELASQVGAFKGDVQTERNRSIQYNILQREVDTNRGLYDALLQRYKEIGVAGGIGESNISLVDKAGPPQAPYRPNLPLNAVLGLLLGSGFGIAFAVIAHLLFDNIVTAADVRTKLGLPVLGVVPTEPDGRSLFEALDDRKSDVSEAFYSVRTALRFADPGGAPKSLLITSSRPGEGKSTSAYAIASTFARTGTKVLLIDADLRKPTFVSQQAEGRGLAWLLGSEDPITDYIEQTKTPNLSLLPVGRFTGSAAELLGSARLPHIGEEAGKLFDLVVFDGPPVLGLTDAPLLGAIAEKTIVVVESREARTNAVSEMVRRLLASGTRIAGVILTKVRGEGGYGYNYYSYSYGSEGVGGRVTSDASRALDVGVDRGTA